MPSSTATGSPSAALTQSFTDGMGLRLEPNGSALPRLPIIRFRPAEGFRGFTGSLSLRPVELLVSLADLTRVPPSHRRLLLPSFPTGRSPFPRSDITTVATEQTPPMGLSPIGTSASIAAQAPSLHRSYPARYYEPLRHPSQPGLSLASCQLIHTAITAGTSRVARGPLCLHAVANTPAGRMELVRSYRSTNFGLPTNRGGSAPALSVSGPAQRSLTLRPACSPSRLATLCTRGFSSLVASLL